MSYNKYILELLYSLSAGAILYNSSENISLHEMIQYLLAVFVIGICLSIASNYINTIIETKENFLDSFVYPYDYPYIYPGYFYSGCNETVFGDIKCLPKSAYPFL
jgi:hypothetical protein